MAKKTLDEILTEKDETGLLSDVKPVANSATSEGLRARQTFEEINLFVDQRGYVPGEREKPNPAEKMLQFALRGIRENATLVAALAAYDRHRLLTGTTPVKTEPASLDEIISSESPLLSTAADDIFTFRNAPTLQKARPDRVAERRPCKEFASFKPLFDACAEDLKAGRRQSLEFRREQEIKAGQFFILNGTMLYVAEVNDPHTRNGRTNARLRLIFDSGTEGDNLLRSLTAELYKDGPAGRGRRVTAGDDGPLFTGEQDVEYRPSTRTVPDSTEEVPAGYAAGEIYIVRSLSDHPSVKALAG